MALADISIADGQGSPVTHVFSYIGSDKQGRIVRKDLTRTPDLPLLLTIGHQTQRQAGVTVDAHLVKIADSRMDADGVTVRYADVAVTCRVDPDIYTDGLADDFAAYLRNFFSSANMRLIMKGAVL